MLRLLIVGLVLLTNSMFLISAPLNGVYTIGGTSPNYSTINSAITDLNNNGISGPVTFNIRSGTYVARLLIGAINGSSSVNTITFQSESQNANDVIIQHTHTAATTNQNYTLYVDGGDNLVFRHLTLAAIPVNYNSTDANRVIYITNDADNIKFNNNIIKSWYTTNNSTDYTDCVYIGTDYNTSTSNDYIEFNNNKIIGGYCGIKYRGSKSSNVYYGQNIYIRNNQFDEQGSGAIYVSLNKNTVIEGNKIKSSAPNVFYTGIYISGNKDTLEVKSNYINVKSSGYGLNVTGSKSNSINSNYISNNIIIMGTSNSSNSAYGISTSANNGIKYCFNTVNIISNSRTSSGVFLSNDTCSFLNNVVYVKNGDYCLRINDNNQSVITSDYNVFFNNNNDSLIKRLTLNYDNLNDYAISTGNELHSLQLDPQFANNDWPVSLNPQINNKGTPINNILVDYLGVNRSILTPDIGAVEFNLPFNNAGLVSTNVGTSVLCPYDSIPVFVKIKNTGTINLESLLLKYKLNENVYGSFSWIGSIPAGGSDSILVDYLNVPLSDNELNFKIWCELPNNSADSFPFNDTLSYSLSIPLKGTYYVGPSNADFTSLKEAANALNKHGVCGPVNIKIYNGVYNESVVFSNVMGTSSTNTVTIQSVNNDSSLTELNYTASSANTNFVLQFSACNNFILKGLTIYAKSTSYNTALSLVDCNNILISSCIIKGVNASMNNYLVDCINFAVSTSNYRITIFNNVITAGYCQLRFYNVNFHEGTDNVVSNNIFNGNCYQSIHTEYQNNFNVSQNVFLGSRYSTYGIWRHIRGIGASVFERNKINVTSSGAFLLNYETCGGSTFSNPNLIRNNFFVSTGSVGTKAINLSNTYDINNYFKIHHNNFNISCTDTSNYRAIISWTNTTNVIEIYNNIFSTNCGYVYEFYVLPGSNVLKSDNNSFFSANNIIAKQLNSPVTNFNFNSWSVSSNRDLNSVYSLPSFVSNNDLHISGSAFLDQKGITIAGNNYDIDNELRASPPDIGADEFVLDSANYFDVSIVKILEPDSSSCLLPDSLSILIYNKSNFPVTSLVIRWFLFDDQRDSSVYNVNIMPHDTVKLPLAKFNFNLNTQYDFKTEILYLNNMPDNLINDNVYSTSCFYLDNVLIKSKPDGDCNDKVLLYIKQYPNTGIMWSTGETSPSIKVSAPGTYTVNVSYVNGCVKTGTISIN